jgi:Domain of unknown function DUF29
MPTTIELDAKAVAALYDTDLYAWANTNAELLRQGKYQQLDVHHLIEEIQDMGKSEFRAMESHLQNVLMHLLKWQFQPLLQSSSWRASIDNARVALQKLLRDNPSFKPKLEQAMADEYPYARKNAGYETGLALVTFPVECPYSIEQVLTEDWLPI